MADTPRTDAALFWLYGDTIDEPIVRASFARRLESELSLVRDYLRVALDSDLGALWEPTTKMRWASASREALDTTSWETSLAVNNGARYKELVDRLHDVLAALSYHGTISARDDRVSALMDALHNILRDNGLNPDTAAQARAALAKATNGKD